MDYFETFEYAERVPYFTLCLFAGNRPCIQYREITKLKPESVRLDTGALRAEPQVSTVKMKRIVAIQPNFAVSLQLYPLTKFRIVPPDSMNTRALVFKEFGLTYDVLRHTFISMYVAKFRSMGEATLQASNSESIIRKHYRWTHNPVRNPSSGRRFSPEAHQPRPLPSLSREAINSVSWECFLGKGG